MESRPYCMFFIHGSLDARVVCQSPAQPSLLFSAPRGALPATPPDQLESTGATRPGRPSPTNTRLVAVTQGHKGHPAAGSRRRTPSYEFTSTKQTPRHTLAVIGFSVTARVRSTFARVYLSVFIALARAPGVAPARVCRLSRATHREEACASRITRSLLPRAKAPAATARSPLRNGFARPWPRPSGHPGPECAHRRLDHAYWHEHSCLLPCRAGTALLVLRLQRPNRERHGRARA